MNRDEHKKIFHGPVGAGEVRSGPWGVLVLIAEGIKSLKSKLEYIERKPSAYPKIGKS